MTRRVQLWCLASGPALVVLAFVGLVLVAGLVPPPSPEDSPEEIRRLFIDDQARIRIGMVLVMIAMGLIIPWAVALAMQTRRAAPDHPILFYIQCVCGGIGTVVGINFALLVSLAAFRPEDLSPETTRLLDDALWFWWLIPWPPFSVWMAAVAAAILLDRSRPPVFPRWAAYLSLWCGLLYTPGSLAIFFKSGAFSFNGLVVWYVPTIAFFVWILIMTRLTIAAINRE